MKGYIVDASVGAKWCLPSAYEQFVPEAENLLEAFKRKEIRLAVPELFWTEVANALWKSVRRQKWAFDDALAAFSVLQKVGISTLPTAALLPQALAIANFYNRTVYDSVYVALALESSMEMITADERLANTLAAYFPVKWLGMT